MIYALENPGAHAMPGINEGVTETEALRIALRIYSIDTGYSIIIYTFILYQSMQVALRRSINK